MDKFIKKILKFFSVCVVMLAVSNMYYGNITVAIDGIYNNGTQKPISPIDFGAKGDGLTDDSQAFVAMLSHLEKNKLRIAELKGSYVYNLGNKTIRLPHRTIFKFDNCILKNAILVGDNTTIIADPERIFDQITLSGNFINTENVFVEWFGTFPNDIKSLDLKLSLEKLNQVFFNVKLNQGVYYTKIGNIELKGISGQSQNLTFIEFQSSGNGNHLFHMGKIKGKVSERTYEYNTLSSVGLVLSAPKKVYDNSLIVIGACHKADVRDVKFIMNSGNTSLLPSELQKLSKDFSKNDRTNNAIVFDGASELITLSNIFTLSDIGVRFRSGSDFVTISNLTTWCGNNGLASVYFDDSSVSNLLFTGAQSWSQGVFGVYAADGVSYNNFVNTKFENLRIEQLNVNIKEINKVVATSFWFGKYSHIPNLNIDNVMLAGTANGLRFGEIKDGQISLRNICVFHDPKTIRDFAMKADFLPSGNLSFKLDNVHLAPDIPVLIKNGEIKNSLEQKRNILNYYSLSQISTL